MTPRSWNVDTALALSTAEADLSVKNPAGGEVVAHRSPNEILDEIATLDAETAEVLNGIKGLL